jgi:PAS domain S-box-containing protein
VEINLQLLRSICHPDDVASVSKFVESALVDTKPLNVEFRIVRSDGEIRWVFLSARGQFNDSGQLLNIHGVIFDSTERNASFERLCQQEALLKDQNLELEALYSCMPLGIAYMDRDLRFLRVNERLAVMSGRSMEDHIGRSLYEIVPGLAVKLESIYRELYHSGRPILDVEISGATPAEPDSVRHWLVNFYPVRLHDGELKGACAVVLDITTRKLAENAILATSLKLKHLNQRLMRVEEEIKRKVAQELHDEFGQTLTGLKLMIEAIRDGSGEQKEYASSALSLVIQLISQTRTLSLNLRPPMLDDLGLIATLSWFCKDYHSKTHIQVNFNHEGIGTRRFPSEIEVVAFRLVQEGLTNIARHAKTSEADLLATVREKNLVIELIDTGIGFTVSDSPNWTKSHGLLGMHERAESIGGRLTIESSLGKGTRIQAILPLAHKPLREVEIKGVSGSVDVLERMVATSARPRVQAAFTRALTPLVGRQREIEVFNKLVEQTAAGRGHILALVGEPGIGKSRLVHEFTHNHLPSGWLVLEGESVSYGRAAPCFSLTEMLRRYFQIHEGHGRMEIQERVVMHVLELDSTLKTAIPPILSLLGGFPEENQAPASGQCDWLSRQQDLLAMVKRFGATDPQQRRRHTLDAIKRVLIRESQRQPLVLVLEDLHWIDSGAQAFLDRFTESLPLTRILLLVDYRPEYNHSWTDKAYYTEIRVDPLQPTSSEELFQHLLGPNTDLMPLKKTLIEHTVGNPLFAEESVRSLVEAGVLIGEKGAYRPDLTINEIRIPTTVQNLVGNRIGQLPMEEKRILQIASVIGVIVPFTLLRVAVEIEDEDLHRHLSNLQTAEFLYQTNRFPEVEYAFKHAITCEVAYGELSNDRRIFWHRRVLEALESNNQLFSHDRVEKLAHHAFCGEIWEKAVGYLKDAGDTAISRSNFRNAVLHYERSLEALRHLPDSSDNARRGIDLRFDIRNTLFLLNEFKRGFEYLEEAKEAARALNDHDRLGKLLTWVTAYWNLVGKSEEAAIAGKQALEHSVGLRNIDSSIVSRYFLGIAYNNLGQFELSIQELKSALSLIPEDRKFDFFGTTGILSVLCRTWLIRGLAQTGHFSETLEYGNEAIQSAVERDHPFSIVYAYYAAGAVAVIKGDFDHAIGPLEKGLRVCESAEIPVQQPLIVSCLAVAYAFIGRFDEALGLLDSITDRKLWVRGTGTRKVPLGKAMGMVWQVETYMFAGRHSEAEVLARQALEVFRENKDRGSEAWLRYLLAELLVRHHPSSFSQAEESYRAASILAHELGMRPLQAHCYLGLGQIYAQSKNTRMAQSEIGTARELYHAMHMSFWVDKSASALTAIS